MNHQNISVQSENYSRKFFNAFRRFPSNSHQNCRQTAQYENTLESMRDDKQKKKSPSETETVYIYAPLAYRLGLYNIKSELEDLSLKYNNPDVYYDIANKLELAKDNREKYVEEFKRSFGAT